MLKRIMFAVLSFLGCYHPAEDAISMQVRDIVASQYQIKRSKVMVTRPFRDYGRETGLGDEMNYIDVIQRVEDCFGISLPDDRVLDKSKVGLELIPSVATPKWLTQIIRECLSSALVFN